MRIVLQCGLAKTGTTFLQKSVFNQFDIKKNGVLFNPNELLGLLAKCLQHNRDHGEIPGDFKNELRQCINVLKKQYNPKVLFCSYEPFGGGTTAWEFPSRIKALKELLPEAEIIVTLRYQTDWLVSLYKQHIHHASNPYIGPKAMRILSKHKMITINEFLNYYNGKFSNDDPSLEYVNVDIHYFDWGQWVNDLYRSFGKDKTFIFFYEDLRRSPEEFTKNFLKIVSREKQLIEDKIDFNKRYNPGFSSRAIDLTGKKIYLSSLLPFHLNWNKLDEWLEVRSMFFLKKSIKKFIMFFSWANTMRRFDYLSQRNGSLLESGLRNDLDQEFKKMNLKLLKVLEDVGNNIEVPKVYYQ